MTAGSPLKLARKMISSGNGAGNSIELSVEELRASRRNALRRTEEAEAGAQEARMLAKVHTEAAEALTTPSYQAEAQARQFDALGDPKQAAAARRTSADLRKLADQNYVAADEKGAIAAGFEQEAYRHRSHAAEIEAQIRKKMEECGRAHPPPGRVVS